MARVTRIAHARPVNRDLLMGTEAYPIKESTAGWVAIDEEAFRSILEAAGISADDLVFPLPGWGDTRTKRHASKLIRVAAARVRERISRDMERGAVGNMVKAASGNLCQIGVGLGEEGLRWEDRSGG